MSPPRAARPPWLTGGGRAAVTVGTVRATSMEETWARLAPLLPGRGVARMADLTDLDTLGIPVWTAIRPGASTLVASAGKGIDHRAARISAAMESLEVAIAENTHPAPAYRGSTVELAPGYRTCDLSRHPVSLVDDHTELDWVQGWDLVSGKPGLVPAAAVGLRGWAAPEWQPATFVTTTNGLAGGNDHVEATVHGLYELIERDALAQLTDGRAAPVDPDSLGERLAGVMDRIRAAGAEPTLERIPSVPGTWAYTCWLSQPEMWQIFAGSGCHSDPWIAAERAVLEAVQSRGSTISGGRDDIPEWTFRMPGAPPRHHGTGSRALEALAAQPTPPDTLSELLDAVVAAVHQRTRRPVIVIDLTPEADPWPAVVQVFAPGLGLVLAHPRPSGLGSRSFL